MDIITISQNILIVGGALFVILAVIAMFLVILLLLKLNGFIKDIRHKYDVASSILFAPFEFVTNLLSKFLK